MTAEFSRPVPLSRIGPEPHRQEISAGAAERDALARRFDLIALDRLSASVELVKRDDRLVLLRARFDAAFVQSCVVTLDPVNGEVSQEFALLYGPPDMEDHIGDTDDDAAFEPLTGVTIDVGEAVAQEFSLALPPFPRAADAHVEEAASPPTHDQPFAALSRLVERRRG
jgi:uncharacterized metal-binding protein YceD (DUF177 family)